MESGEWRVKIIVLMRTISTLNSPFSTFNLNKMRLTVFFIFLLFFTKVFSQSYNELIDFSFKYIETNDYLSAETSLKEAMRLEPANPRNVLLLSNLGTIQRNLGKQEDAVISYTAALSRAPRNVTFLANRASLYTEMGLAENAITDYTSLLWIEEYNEDALYERGLLYLRVKNFSAAQTDFEKIVEINPNTLSGRMGIASICKLRKEYNEAEKIYAFLMEKVHDNADLYAGRAELYLLTEKHSKAMSDINRSISINPQNPYTYMLRARVKLLQYEKASARSDIEKAISLGYSQEDARELLQLCK